MTVPPPGWDTEVLKAIERQLTRILGPVARVMIKRGAAATTDIDRLYKLLAENLANSRGTRAFLAGRKLLPGDEPPSAGAGNRRREGDPGVAAPLTAEAIEQGDAPARRRSRSDRAAVAKTGCRSGDEPPPLPSAARRKAHEPGRTLPVSARPRLGVTLLASGHGSSRVRRPAPAGCQ